MLEQLQAVLDLAHAGHVYITDQQRHGIPEHWAPELVGDCDSFALWCRDQLAAQGIPANLVYCLLPDGGGHLVCSTDDGWVLDNRHRWLTRRDDLPYTWLSLGSPDGRWRELD